MKTIHKYELKLDEQQTVKMPKGAEILSVQSNGFERSCLCGKVWVWALVDPNLKKTDTHVFNMYETGAEVRAESSAYLASAQFEDGRYVVHVFHYIQVDPRDQPRWP